jgi:hypothetical protein
LRLLLELSHFGRFLAGLTSSQVNTTGDMGNTGLTKDIPMIEFSPNPLGIPTESLKGNLWYHYALTEYLLGDDAQWCARNLPLLCDV